MSGSDNKIVFELSVILGVQFLNVRDIREGRTAVQSKAQFFKLRQRARGENLYAAVWQIFDVAAEAQLPRGILREVAEPHALHGSRDIVASG